MQILSRNVNFDSRARPWSLVCFRRTRARKACHAREQCRPDATAPNPGSLERTSEARPPRLDGVKPARRTEGLVLTELMGEVLVYDLERHRAHCLNPAAAVVFKHCDGTRSVEDLAALLERELGAPAHPDCVWLALDRLGKARLLRQRVSRPKEAGRLSRRELVRRVGVAALLPAVTSLVAPTSAEAAASCVNDCTGKPFGTPCYSVSPVNCEFNGCLCNGAGACTVGGGAPPCTS